MNNDISVITPHAAFLIWNYTDRLGTDGISKDENAAHEVDQHIISTLSLKSISTNKSKSAANGTFDIRLAPTKNWVQLITPGSWCAILMGRDKLTRDDVDGTVGKANSKNVKLFGRVDSVRVNTSVDQATGARMTEYIVTGVDWGAIFNSILSVDPAMAMDAKNKDTPLGYVTQLIYNAANEGQGIKGITDASTYHNMRVLLSLWGSKEIQIGDTGFKVKPKVRFRIPKEVVKYFGFSVSKDSILTDSSNNNVADIVNIYHGSLKKINNRKPHEDSYDSYIDSYGVIQGEDILNQVNIWSVLNAVTNNILNELICDLRWEDGKPKLALYKRVKPFIVNKGRVIRDDIVVGDDVGANEDGLDEYISEYKNIRRIEIPLNEVVSFNGGTNWADKINFIEVKVIDSQFSSNVGSLIRLNAQFYDEIAVSREGLRPFVARSRFIPAAVLNSLAKEVKDDKVSINENEDSRDEYVTKPKNINRDNNASKKMPAKDVTRITQWKYLFKEWYFDTHRMLNGSISFFGQDTYIQVGDNIIVNARIAGYAQNINVDQINNRGDAYLLMHVESISHSFTVTEDGARHFTTSVNFVRGIIVGKDGYPFSTSKSDGLIDQDVRDITIKEELNNHVIATKTYMDPD